jgi:excisionase family DNA binding protein
MTDREPLTYTVEEAAQLLRIGKNQAYEAVRRGDIPSISIGRRRLIPRAKLLALLNGGTDAA